jgi:hypothetical protein
MWIFLIDYLKRQRKRDLDADWRMSRIQEKSFSRGDAGYAGKIVVLIGS